MINNEIAESQYLNFLPPANPILSKSIEGDQTVNIKIHNDNFRQQYLKNVHKIKKQDQRNPISLPLKSRRDNLQQVDVVNLFNTYKKLPLVYIKHENYGWNVRLGKEYFASVFTNLYKKKADLPKSKGTIIENEDLEFNSNFQSGNLFAVFKVGIHQYDLILQNDLNTSAYTQWYNFSIINKSVNFIAKFNIINLYKAKSLYSEGMKPVVRSEKSDKDKRDKTWRRKGFNIYYEKNGISCEGQPNKCYKTLSFEYDFTVKNDTVHFSHAIPYDFERLQNFLKEVNSNCKVELKSVGLTFMKKQIPLVKIRMKQQNDKLQKKAIVILGRQHPGQTPGSFFTQQIINQLLYPSPQINFLTWRFDFFIFPMVNIDGVILGNYRGNFSGFDLNRCWSKPHKVYQPQVYCIYHEIKKIKSKYKVELILDFHGHSRMMGSFFYGNNFGKSPMLFPFIASKNSPHISFEKSKFSIEKRQKASTARAVLGNLIRQTGNVYTFEVSFYGSYKNGNKFSFNLEHYKELTKAIINAMYRTYMEIYKQEDLLKESHFLKEINKELKQFSNQKDQSSNSGSDDEAQQLAKLEEKSNIIKIQEQQVSIKKIEANLAAEKVSKKPLKEDNQWQQAMSKMQNEQHGRQIKHKIKQIIERNQTRSKLPSIYQNEVINQIKNYNQSFSQQLKKYKYFSQKLKIAGQSYSLKNRNDGNMEFIKPRQNKHNKNFQQISKTDKTKKTDRIEKEEKIQIIDREQKVDRNERIEKRLHNHSSLDNFLYLERKHLIEKKSKKMNSQNKYKDIEKQIVIKSFNTIDISPRDTPSISKPEKINFIRGKYKYPSTVIKEIKKNNQQSFADIVHINRLGYQKIKREQKEDVKLPQL